MPTLSVLMPVYNAQRFLAQAIESILQQTFTDFEFIIIDDGSTDDSVKIINTYQDPRIRFYQNSQNVGITATLNKGIELARTEWIVRMDSDDISYPERLQRQWDYITQNPDGGLYSCWVKVVNQDGNFLRIDQFKSDEYYYNLNFICWIYHPSVVLNKAAVQSVGMYTVPYAEDFELFWQLSRKYKLYHQQEVLLDYRVTDQSLHQVLKKKEYQKAQQQQLLRNLRYYAGEDYEIKASFIECLQHNFEPLLQEGSIREIVDCIRELDFLTTCILKKENINKDVLAIKRTAFFKRDFIISHFYTQLPYSKKYLFVIKIGEMYFIKKVLKEGIKNWFSKILHLTPTIKQDEQKQIH